MEYQSVLVVLIGTLDRAVRVNRNFVCRKTAVIGRTCR